MFLLDWGVPGRGGRRPRPRVLRLRRPALGHPRDAARVRRGGADAARLVHRRHAVRDARGARARQPGAQPRAADHARSTPTAALYTSWIRRDSFDPEPGRRRLRLDPGRRDRLRQQDDEAGHQLLDAPIASCGRACSRARTRATRYQPMAKWVADNPPFPGRAFREWTTWMYKENRLVDGPPAPARRARRPRRDRAEPARRHRRRRPHRAAARHPAAARPRVAARTSPTSTAPAGTSA